MRFWREVDGLLLRQAADQADNVRAAFIRTVPVDDIVNRWADSRSADDRIAPQAARDWAHNNVQLPEKPLKDALDHVYATGWVIGDDASTAAYAHAKLGIDKAAPTGPQLSAAVNTDWANWKPGNRPAAALVRPPNGLKKLLDKSGATVKEINGTTLDRIGTLLADSLNSGAGYGSLARNLLRDNITSAVIKDSARAQTIAVTEMSRALNTSTVDNYGAFGVEKVEWLAIDTGTCEICPANEAQGPIPIGEMFESGDTEPPAHPNCRCTVLPVVDEGAPAAQAEPEEGFSTDEMEISDVADHGVEDIMATASDTGLTAATRDLESFIASNYPVTDAAQIDARSQKAIKLYSGYGHSGINGTLRNIESLTLADIDEDWLTAIAGLDDAFKNLPAATAPRIAYRGVGPGELTNELLSLHVGDTFSDAGFISTTETKNVAHYFASGTTRDAGMGTLIKIELPAGTKALTMSDYVDTQVSEIEKELLLNRNSTFEVVSIKNRTVTVRLVK